MRNILVLTGPSGVGKTSVAEKILSMSDKFSFVRSATTRPKREDKYGEEYIYLEREAFLRLLDSSEMLEYTEYSGNYYGTPKSELERIFTEGKTPLLILDICGAVSIKKLKEEFTSVNIYLWEEPTVIEDRLYSRAPRDTVGFEKRKSANKRDYKSLSEYGKYFDVFLRSEEISKTAEDCISIFKKAKDEEIKIDNKIFFFINLCSFLFCSSWS